MRTRTASRRTLQVTAETHALLLRASELLGQSLTEAAYRAAAYYRRSLADGPQPHVHFDPILVRSDGTGGLTTEVVAPTPHEQETP